MVFKKKKKTKNILSKLVIELLKYWRLRVMVLTSLLFKTTLSTIYEGFRIFGFIAASDMTRLYG